MSNIETALRRSVRSNEDFTIATALYRLQKTKQPDEADEGRRALAILARRYPRFLDLMRKWELSIQSAGPWGVAAPDRRRSARV